MSVEVIKIIHASDFHLGAMFRSLGDKSKMHRVDCQNVFSKVISKCIEERINALLISGDLFDNTEPQKSLVKFVIDEFKKLENENINVFISSGNHDSHKDGGIWSKYEFPKNVVIFNSHDMEHKELGNMVVYGLSYTDDTKEPLKGFKAKDSNSFKVGVIHGSVIDISWDLQDENIYRPITKSDLDNCGLDYIALGHYHDIFDVGDKVKCSVKCLYPGCPEPLSFKNEKDHYVLLITYANGNITIDKLKTNIREFETVEMDCTIFESDSEIRRCLEKSKGENKAFRLILKGNPPLYLNIDTDLLLDEFRDQYFFLKIVDNTHIPDNINEDETIRGNFIRLIKLDIQNENDPEKKKILENAMRTGIGHIDGTLI